MAFQNVLAGGKENILRQNEISDNIKGKRRQFQNGAYKSADEKRRTDQQKNDFLIPLFLPEGGLFRFPFPVFFKGETQMRIDFFAGFVHLGFQPFRRRRRNFQLPRSGEQYRRADSGQPGNGFFQFRFNGGIFRAGNIPHHSFCHSHRAFPGNHFYIGLNGGAYFLNPGKQTFVILGGKAHLLGGKGYGNIFYTGKILDFSFHLRGAVGTAEIFHIIYGFFQAVVGHGTDTLGKTPSANVTVFRVRMTEFTGTVGAVHCF